MLSSHSKVIDQSITLLQELSVAEYQQICQPLFSASIGQHIRHILDHFDALMRGMTSAIIDYNYRSRQSQTETCLDTALCQLNDVKAWLLSLTPEQLSIPLKIVPENSLSEMSSQTEIDSSIARELMFCSSHAIHHFALVNIIRQLQGATVDGHFGVAPATIVYQQSLQN